MLSNCSMLVLRRASVVMSLMMSAALVACGWMNNIAMLIVLFGIITSKNMVFINILYKLTYKSNMFSKLAYI